MIVGEFGTIHKQGTGFDLSANTALSLIFTRPDGTTLTVTPTLGTVALVTTSLGTFAANTWVQYTFLSGQIDQAGDWTARVTASFGASKTLLSTQATFPVLS